MPVDRFHVLKREVAPPNPGLIRDDKQQKTALLQPPQGCSGAGNNDNVFKAVQVISLLDDHAIAVEKHGALHEWRLKLASNSSGLTVAVPTFPTTTPAA